mmetsp:Transcript_42604/g.96307  ORF Transcript_42604/g.96307 Transcript_42604/m.96307 type:complete len:207 (+) Transcript_42604:608-1228(+)
MSSNMTEVRVPPLVPPNELECSTPAALFSPLEQCSARESCRVIHLWRCCSVSRGYASSACRWMMRSAIGFIPGSRSHSSDRGRWPESCSASASTVFASSFRAARVESSAASASPMVWTESGISVKTASPRPNARQVKRQYPRPAASTTATSSVEYTTAMSSDRVHREAGTYSVSLVVRTARMGSPSANAARFLTWARVPITDTVAW